MNRIAATAIALNVLLWCTLVHLVPHAATGVAQLRYTEGSR